MRLLPRPLDEIAEEGNISSPDAGVVRLSGCQTRKALPANLVDTPFDNTGPSETRRDPPEDRRNRT